MRTTENAIQTSTGTQILLENYIFKTRTSNYISDYLNERVNMS